MMKSVEPLNIYPVPKEVIAKLSQSERAHVEMLSKTQRNRTNSEHELELNIQHAMSSLGK